MIIFDVVVVVGLGSTAHWLLAVCCHTNYLQQRLVHTLNGSRCAGRNLLLLRIYLFSQVHTRCLRIYVREFFFCLKLFYSFGTLNYKTVAKTISACSMPIAERRTQNKGLWLWTCDNVHCAKFYGWFFGLVNLKPIQEIQNEYRSGKWRNRLSGKEKENVLYYVWC